MNAPGDLTAIMERSAQSDIPAITRPRGHAITFTCFPRLPIELKEMIWKLHAAMQQTPRAFGIAPDPKAWYDVDQDGVRCERYLPEDLEDEDIAMRVIPDRYYSIPTLLTIIRDLRAKYIGEYVPLGVAHASSFEPLPGVVYIHKKLDTIYFKDDEKSNLEEQFWFLKMMLHHATPEEYKMENYSDETLLRLDIQTKFLDSLAGIENLAIDRIFWEELHLEDYDYYGNTEGTINWLRLLPSLKTVALIYGHSFPSTRIPFQLEPLETTEEDESEEEGPFKNLRNAVRAYEKEYKVDKKHRLHVCYRKAIKLEADELNIDDESDSKEGDDGDNDDVASVEWELDDEEHDGEEINDGDGDGVEIGHGDMHDTEIDEESVDHEFVASGTQDEEIDYETMDIDQ